jgi:hypothetical protein
MPSVTARLPLALLALCACAGSPERSTSITQLHLADSAIVTIPDAAPDGQYTMSTIMGATQASNGAVAVWTASAELYLFDSTGAYLSMPGRKGNGPGELRTVSGVGECSAGTFTVWDPMGRHLLLIDATDGSVRDRNPGVQELITRFAGCQQGHPVIVYWPFDFSTQELKQESLAVVRLDTLGTRLDTVYVGNGVLHAGPVMQLFPVIPPRQGSRRSSRRRRQYHRHPATLAWGAAGLRADSHGAPTGHRIGRRQHEAALVRPRELQRRAEQDHPRDD